MPSWELYFISTLRMVCPRLLPLSLPMITTLEFPKPRVAPGIDPGFTTVVMDATANWYLKISAADFMPITGTGSIPINNLGVWCQAQGVHQFGIEVACQYQSENYPLGLLNSDQTLIDLEAGNSNSGTGTDNIFQLNWVMGTMKGTMNTESMFIQLSQGLFTQGTYQTNVILTMVEVP